MTMKSSPIPDADEPVMAALANGMIVNFTNLASDTQVRRTTIYEHFDILKDTLVLHELPARRKGRSFQRGTPGYGEALETLLMHELVSYSDYRTGEPLSFWRTTSGYEVDFLLGDHTAIELKAASNVRDNELRSLRALSEEAGFKRLLCVSLERTPRRVGSVEILPLKHFLEALWAGEWT